MTHSHTVFKNQVQSSRNWKCNKFPLWARYITESCLHKAIGQGIEYLFLKVHPELKVVVFFNIQRTAPFWCSKESIKRHMNFINLFTSISEINIITPPYRNDVYLNILKCLSFGLHNCCHCCGNLKVWPLNLRLTTTVGWLICSRSPT